MLWNVSETSREYYSRKFHLNYSEAHIISSGTTSDGKNHQTLWEVSFTLNKLLMDYDIHSPAPRCGTIASVAFITVESEAGC
jgi:hypothetical protein